MKKISMTMAGIIVDAQIFGNKVYLKVNNPMLRPIFVKMLASKGVTPEEKGEWTIFEIKDQTEQQIHDFLIDNFKKGGWNIVQDG